MKSKRFLSLILSLTIIFGALPSAYAEAASVKINMTAQGGGAFLCAPQFDVVVYDNEAENYGFDDEPGGVTALDALVKLHEIKYGSNFTRANATNYLVVTSGEYGASVEKLFETPAAANGFIVNGGYPNDGTTFPGGGYNGTTVANHMLSAGDTVEFFLYQDENTWSDELIWFNYKGAAITEMTAKPGAQATLILMSYAYLYGYTCKDADAIHALGSAVGGAQLAYVNTADGRLTPIEGAVTQSDGKAVITLPQSEGVYYLTTYISEKTAGEPLIMSLTKITVDKNAPESNPCDLANLSVSTLDGKLNIIPAFNKNTTDYSVETINIPMYNIRNLGVMAAAEDPDSVITIECNDNSATVNQTATYPTWLYSALLGGKNNILKITVTNGTQKKVYQVKIPMRSQTNTAPMTFSSGDSALIALGDSYSLDLSMVFYDPDEIDTITYSVSLDGAAAVAANKNYVFTPTEKGTHTLEFTANDSQATSNTYTVLLTVAQTIGNANAAILTAQTDSGDFYPSFAQGIYNYNIVTENGAAAPTVTYTVADGCTVKMGGALQTADSDGNYRITPDTGGKKITVQTADGSCANVYTFKNVAKSAFDLSDRVVDYLCIGSQYTNNIYYGAYPEETFMGYIKSLGNFGGYITYYYDEPITDNPKNKYGMDFYVIGNGSENGIASSGEPGQVYVSEDGETWYALAGSEYYDSKTIRNYTITYTKDGEKASWRDNLGNTMDYDGFEWPKKEFYPMNNVADTTSYTFNGILLKSMQGTVTGDGTTAANAAEVKFGYADYYESNVSGNTLSDVNPYVASPSKANGFDLAWAVDDSGNPVDVSEKEFHYIKVATASNIKAGSFNEKSTEVSYVARTVAQTEEVGKTTAPTGVTISDGADRKVVKFTDESQVYSVNLDNMKYVSIAVNGANGADNIYVNNRRISAESAADGFKITKENGETRVRVIVQNGNKEPKIYLLKLTSNATDSGELIEDVKITAGGAVREAQTSNGSVYTAAVGHRISEIAINPIVASGTNIEINGAAPAASYQLEYGDNRFEISASDGDNRKTVVLTVKRDNAPSSSSNNINVSFALYGDTKHGSGTVHTYKNNKAELSAWIAAKTYTVSASSTVLDVFECALAEAGLTYSNDGGNYILEIDGLAEFDNGALSGWMYSINGSYVGLSGIAEQTLRNGDRIVFHYTDDYSSEKDAKIWSGSGGATSVKPSATEKPAEIPKPEENNGEESGTVFGDVEKGSWYEAAVLWAVENGIFAGISETEFAPEVSLTRAMLVSVLYRMSGDECDNAENIFEDVADGTWYSEAVAWATKNSITSGISETEFAPESNITREQLAVILYNYAKFMGYAVDASADLEKYDDAKNISAWAKEAFAWAVGTGLISGVGESELAPADSATRAQTVAILMRFCEIFEK